MAKPKVDAKRFYTLSEIRDQGIFPWASHPQTIRKIVKNDYWGANVLKAEISGAGRGTEYRIKGSNIMRFLKIYGPGLMAGASKTYGRSKAGSASGGR